MKLPAGHWSTAVSVLAACTASRSVQLPLFVRSSLVVLGVMVVVAHAELADRQTRRIAARVAELSRFMPGDDRNLARRPGAQERSYRRVRLSDGPTFLPSHDTSGAAA